MKSAPELFKKYNIPGPRYTSYPTVPYWEKAPTEAQWLSSIQKSLTQSMQDGIGASVYFHIPFCQSLCTYCGCNTRITRNHSHASTYVDTIIKEWELYRKHISSEILLSELHLGGGTPTYLTPKELNKLITGILSKSRLASFYEFSIEADPRVTRQEHLETLASLYFKRISLGIQDFDPKVQNIVHRTQSEAQVRSVTDMARELGFESINYDLIYGLPLQTLKSIEQTIQAVCRLRPDRIAFYGYAHVPWIKPSQRRFTEADLPSADERRALYELGRTLLESAGYYEIGMDHFALKTDSLWSASVNGKLHRNFMGYISRQVSPLIGLGVSSIGDCWSVFAQNEKQLEKYTQCIETEKLPIFRGHMLNDEDTILRQHILNLMTRLTTEWDLSENYTAWLDSVPPKLTEFIEDALLEVEVQQRRVRCKIRESGRPFMRNICMAFDARLNRQVPETQLFSKTI
ncbi:MAG: oxygen-independent coproporphyrinogen III oxidase [Deltaproteobacteria bacterium]|nr:oxygen-independent coproporphyrinogen III oxidase [Deltaproteobacteria bacterium]